MAYKSIDQIHQEISQAAAEIANKDRRIPEIEPTLSGSVFREASVRSFRGGLAIELMPGLEAILEEPQLEDLRQIGREAMHAAIVEKQDLFVGAVVGDLREGRNYFNRFVDYDDQMSLF